MNDCFSERNRIIFVRATGALASTTGTTTIAPQIKNFIGGVSKNERAARAVRSYEQSSAKQQREITIFIVLMATCAQSRKCFKPLLHVETFS